MTFQLRFYPKNDYFCSRNFLSMDKKTNIRNFILELPKRGRITFSTEDIYRQFPSLNKMSVTSSLRRLVEKRKIQSVWHGFYVVIPVEYELKGIVPPVLYINQLMKYLQKEYYIGLLNAAAFYGAAHQQPQEFTLVTNGNSLRNKLKNGVKINFVLKKEIPSSYIRQHTTKTGYVYVSTPEMTAMDLLLYQKETGGLSRAGTVLSELVEEIDFNRFTPDFLRLFPITVIQRFGYILENILEYSDKAKIFLEKVNQADIKFRKTLLVSEKQTFKLSDYEHNKVWNILINEEIEIDE